MAKEPDIRRGSTQPIAVDIWENDLTSLNLHLSFDAGVLIVKASEKGELVVSYDDSGEKPKTVIEAMLTQDDTLAMREGTCKVQLRGFNSDGSDAPVTNVWKLWVGEVIEEGHLPRLEG